MGLEKNEIIFTPFLLLSLSAPLFVVFVPGHIFTFGRRHERKGAEKFVEVGAKIRRREKKRRLGDEN